jgi:NAD(P)-dependent dehydrogenase (short-subunit alcohol dehydrogenase family)
MAMVLVTGANRGIGLELCRQWQARGEKVIGVCRTPSEELLGLGVRVIEGVDVSTGEGVSQLASKLGGVRLDVLMNNAGILRMDTLDALDVEGMREQFEVNALGPLRVTAALLGSLGEGSKVAIITSRMGSVADNTSGKMYGYRMSKAAVNMAGVSLARDLAPRGIAVALLHPGMVATEMTGGRGISAEESVRGLLARVDGLTMETTGTFWHMNGEVLPW